MIPPPHIPSPSLAEHASRLRAVALTGLANTPLEADADARLAYLNGFRDEFLNQRTTDRPLLARVLGVDPGPSPGSEDAAERAWWALHDPSIDPASVLLDLDTPSDAPLVYHANDAGVAIEWRTLDELAALHALWNLALERGRTDWRARCLGAARWHIRELQPDNATNQPWAVHVFLTLASDANDDEIAHAARFHAETLMHACQVQQGRPDIVSAFVLLDGARMLERGAESNGSDR